MKPYQLVVIQERSWNYIDGGRPQFSLRVRWRRLGFLWFTDWRSVTYEAREHWDRETTDLAVKQIRLFGVLLSGANTVLVPVEFHTLLLS